MGVRAPQDTHSIHKIFWHLGKDWYTLVTKCWMWHKLYELYVRLVDLELHFWNALSNAKMSYVWNVYLDERNNLCIHDFSSWGRLGFRKRVCSCGNVKFQNLSGPNSVRWKVDPYTQCVSWWARQTLYSWLLYLRLQRVRSKWLFRKNPRFDLVKLGQTRH